MKTTRLLGALVFTAFAPFFTFLDQSQAAMVSWTNTAGGNWSVAANWSGGALPAAVDDVFITAAGTYTVTQDVHATVANLTLGGSTGRQHLTNVAAVLAVTNVGTILNNGVLGLNGGQLNGPGSYSVAGTLHWPAGILNAPVTIAANGLLELAGTSDKAFYQNVTNHGTLRWSGAHNLYLVGVTIMNAGDGTFEARNDQVMLWNGGDPRLLNAGRLLKSAGSGSTAFGNIPLINTGTVEVQHGIISHSHGSQFLNGTVLTGNGTNLLASGTVLFDGAIHSDNAELAAGALIGTNTLSGTLRWSGGVLASTSDLTVANGSTLDVTGTAERRLDGFLRNQGTIMWTGANTFYVAHGAIENQAGGLFDIRSDQVLAWAGGTPLLLNNGLLRKSAGGGVSTLANVALINRGTVEVQGGILSHSQGSQFLDGTILTGAGTNLLAAGTMLFDGTIRSDNVEFAAGGLIGTNTLTGTLRWSGGVIGNNCVMTVASNATLQVTGTAERRLEGYLVNRGRIEWTGSNTFYFGYGVIDNQTGGLFDVRNNQVMVWAGGSPSIYNSGLLRKSTSGGVTTIDRVVLVNRGTVEIQTGILNHSQGSQFLEGTVLTGAGTNLLVAGTMLFDGTIHSDNAEFAAGGLIGTNTLIGTLRWSGGVIGNNCVMTVASNATLQVTGTAERRLEGYLVNRGLIEWTGSNTFYFAYGAIDNQAGGLFDVRNDQAMIWAGGTPLFLNNGLLRKTAGGGVSTLVNVALINRGTVEVQSGILNHSQGSQFLNGTVLTGAGTNLLAAGTMLFDGTIRSDNAEFAAGGLIGTNTLIGTLRWSGGVIGNNCVMTVASNATLQITGTVERRLEGYLINAGMMTWTDPNNFYIAHGGIQNLPGAVFDTQNNQVILWAGGSPFFNNAGTFRKSSGTGFTDLSGVSFQNTGTVDAQTGIIRFLGSYTQTAGRLRFGLSSLTNFGQVQFAQPAPLVGTLAANILGGFRPKAGDAFAVISYYPSYTGAFAAFDLPNEAAWQTNSSIYGANAVTISVLNARPAIDSIVDKTINEQALLSFSIFGREGDAGQTLSYALVNPPQNASINATSGLFSWTPSEAQGPSTNLIAVRVTDSGTPPLSTTNSFTVVVLEVNLSPVIGAISNRLLVLGDTLRFTSTATDSDIPANALAFQLVNAPEGMSIVSSSGSLTWTPQPAQAPSTNTVVVRVTDNGTPPRADEASFIAVVIPVPSLDIRHIDARRVVVSWPALASQAGFVLTSTTNLNPPVAWSVVTNPLTTLGGTAMVTNAANRNLEVFQLRRP